MSTRVESNQRNSDDNMKALTSRKRRRLSPPATETVSAVCTPEDVDEDSTDLKLAILSSLYPHLAQDTILDCLVASEGSVEAASQCLAPFENRVSIPLSPRKRSTTGYQSSLSSFAESKASTNPHAPPRLITSRPVTRKGRTLHLYSPEDIAAHTPCSIIHNFLPVQEAEDLLKELLEESPTFEKQVFKLFDNVVQSPHSACFYVHSLDEQERQRREYLYNGSYLTDIRQSTPHMLRISSKVQTAVNSEINERIRTHYPNRKKLKYQSPKEWIPNAAFVNCYDGGRESVGYHSDQLTYLGPRAVIGSLSLGVAREFRVRKAVARENENDTGGDGDNESRQENKARGNILRADAEGQISIHLPHNSLLVMHAEMQEEWKHSIHPSQAIDPHPIAGKKRINITYRCYRDSFHPRHTPRCRCGIATVLRCVQRKKENRGRYMWMCHAGNSPGKESCTFFQWAEFDDDGEPPWTQKSIEG